MSYTSYMSHHLLADNGSFSASPLSRILILEIHVSIFQRLPKI